MMMMIEEDDYDNEHLAIWLKAEGKSSLAAERRSRWVERNRPSLLIIMLIMLIKIEIMLMIMMMIMMRIMMILVIPATFRFVFLFTCVCVFAPFLKSS